MLIRLKISVVIHGCFIAAFPTFAAMYPDLQYLLQGLLGMEIPEWVGLFKTFGLFVALGFLAASYVLIQDLKRKERAGLLLPTPTVIETGRPASSADLLWSGITGFLLGFKLGGIPGHWQEIAPNPMGYIFSTEGNLIIGILGAALMAYLKHKEKKKQQLPEPKKQTVLIYPHQRITEFVVIAMVSGLAGAKIFNAFETWDDFIRNPAENLLSSSGLTFYGGLITAGLVIVWYARKHKIPVAVLVDSFAPAMMLAYGIGRLGCHFSGDGDWGIFNSAYVTVKETTLLQAAAPGQFLKTLHQDPGYLGALAREFGNVQAIPHLYVPAPGWLPDWVLGMNYAYNVNNDGIFIPGCTGTYCHVLPVSVFPTPLYESLACLLLFAGLWFLRTRVKFVLHLFGVYLILNGVERFLIEQIRVNSRYDWGFLQPTQAEIISVLFVVSGIAILLFYRQRIDTLVRLNREKQDRDGQE